MTEMGQGGIGELVDLALVEENNITEKFGIVSIES